SLPQSLVILLIIGGTPNPERTMYLPSLLTKNKGNSLLVYFENHRISKVFKLIRTIPPELSIIAIHSLLFESARIGLFNNTGCPRSSVISDSTALGFKT